MNFLSIDCSTTTASAALFDNDRLIASTSWFEERARHEGLFEILQNLLRDAGRTWDTIDTYVVGRGPGAYSGLRVSLLAAQALAAPDQKRVIAVSSMDALAFHLMKLNALESITIVGDARRESIWHGHAEASKIVDNPVKWAVAPKNTFAATCRPSKTLATPHWNELADFRQEAPIDWSWLSGAQVPTAEHIGRMAFARDSSSCASEPLLPLYLHAAV